MTTTLPALPPASPVRLSLTTNISTDQDNGKVSMMSYRDDTPAEFIPYGVRCLAPASRALQSVLQPRLEPRPVSGLRSPSVAPEDIATNPKEAPMHRYLLQLSDPESNPQALPAEGIEGRSQPATAPHSNTATSAPTHYDAKVGWDPNHPNLDTGVWSSNHRYKRMNYGRNYAGKHEPTYYGMEPESLWRQYATNELDVMNDVQDMCKYVAQLRPKSLQDFKPLLILCQSLLQDFMEGRRFLYSREIYEVQKRHSFEVSNYLETIEKMEEEIKNLKGGANYQAKMGLMSKTLSMVASKKEKSMKEKVKEWEDQMNEMRAELESMQAKLNSARIEKDSHRKKIEKFQRQLEYSTTMRKELEENNQALKHELAQITNGIPTILLKDLVRVPALAGHLTNNLVRKQVADKVIFDMMTDTALMEVLVSPQLQQILKDPKFQANLSNPAFIQ
ncbi:hypothetical protein CYMTET_19561, partial [Cymbomonas tetramitiformis]